MSDRPKDAAGETPIERALRLKKAELAAKPQPPGRGKVRRESAAMASGASKPWMKR